MPFEKSGKIDLTQRLLHGARFLVSAERLDQCPPDQGIEIAFAGRSNAGKSSAINRLTNQKNLARTSKTPGRTRLINFFSLDVRSDGPEAIEESLVKLVDLPGYGYAKVDRKTREKWQHHLDDYLTHRKSLGGLILLMDIRHPMKEFDQLMLQWAEQSEMPVHILLTKADKLKFGKAKQEWMKLEQHVRNRKNPVSVQLFSATSGRGEEEAWSKLADWMGVEPETEPQP